MKNRFDSVQGIMKIESGSPSGAVTTTVLPSLHTTRALFSVVTNKGNFMYPTAHRYSSDLTISWNGAEMTTWDNSRQFYRVSNLLSRTVVDNFPGPFNLPASVYNKALADLVEKIRGNVDLSIDLIQWRQAKQMLSMYSRLKSGTIELLSHGMRSILLFEKRAAQRKDRLKRQRLSKFNTRQYDRWYNYNARQLALKLARARLEYVYGVKPLASTMVELGKLIAAPEQGALYKVAGKGREVHSYTVSLSAPTYNEKRVHEIRYFCTIELYLRPQDRVLSNLARISSLNPASILWEAMPFSFVVDWIFNVGSWLRSVETAALYGSTVAFGRQSHGYKGKCDISDVARTKNYQVSARAYRQRTSFNRIPLSSFPTPRFPPMKLELGTERALNGLALAAANASRIDDFIKIFAKR